MAETVADLVTPFTFWTQYVNSAGTEPVAIDVLYSARNQLHRQLLEYGIAVLTSKGSHSLCLDCCFAGSSREDSIR